MFIFTKAFSLLLFTLDMKVNLCNIFSKHMRLVKFAISFEVFAHENILKLVKHQFILGYCSNKHLQLSQAQLFVFSEYAIY